jgi:hypothetical protein
MVKVLSKKPLCFTISPEELTKNNPALNMTAEHHALKNGLLKEALECKLCGKILPDRSVNAFMEHLLREHNTEFIDRCETTFYKKKLIPA